MATSNISMAADLMAAFARRSGLESGAAPMRYLWTDAFATCTFHGLARAGAGARFDALAHRTIEQVHAVLGHFRADDARHGWLRGACGSADGEHPTRAGLRIGKALPERRADQPLDERLEWERDGQYFHYLTRWMQALDRMARAWHAPQLHRWACELADTAHRAFVHATADGHARMTWKMSTDLSRPLVPSMGQHDPLDGLVTALALRVSAGMFPRAEVPGLERAIRDYAAMVQRSALATTDPLGLGSLLMDALQLARLPPASAEPCRPLLEDLLASALASLPRCELQPDAPAGARLGFRELGLAIGLAAVERLAARGAALPAGTRAAVESLRAYLPLRAAINGFWAEPSNRSGSSWTGHRDINEVMLATSLAPGGWLDDTG